MSGFILWFTGLSGAGKSTLASAISEALRDRGVHVECLDGDEVRKNLSYGLGFSREDRDRNIRRIGYVARLLARSGACAITAAISPYRGVRSEIRQQTDRFVEVYCDCPLEALTARDPKGLYRRALAGEIKNFTGVDDPYEAPEAPEVHLRTDLETPEESLQKILGYLEAQGLIAGESPGRRQGLISPYGGSLAETAVKEMATDAQAPALTVTAETADLLRAMGAGLLSPVGGFMSEREVFRVLADGRLENGLRWPRLPLVLPVDAAPSEGETVPLTTSDGRFLATLRAHRTWTAGTAASSSDGSPASGLGIVAGQQYASGVLESVAPEAALAKRARDVRRDLSNKRWSRVGILFAAHLPLRADEHAVRYALETLDGVIVAIPDAHPEHRAAWEALLDNYLPGQRVDLIEVPKTLFASGDEWHGLRPVVGRNLGATHVITWGDEAREPMGQHASAIGLESMHFEDLSYDPNLETFVSSRTKPSRSDRAPLADVTTALMRPEIAKMAE